LTGNKRLFPGEVPLIQVPARCFPVTVHFSRRTELDDYVNAAYRKVPTSSLLLERGSINLTYLNINNIC
jgi:ATP-dependent RNA helicase DHX37/DHR1